MPTPLRNAWRRPRNIPFAKLAPGYVADVSDVPFRTSIAASVGTTPTLTRALAATVVDQDSVVRTAKINEARFPGLRRVENLLTYSQDFSDAAWVKNGTATVMPNTFVAPDGITTGDTLNLPAGSDRVNNSPASITGGNAYVFSVWLSGSGTVNLTLGTSGGAYTYGSNLITLTSTPTRYSLTLLTVSGNTGLFCVIGRYDGIGSSGTATSVNVWGAQLENVTGQSVQTVGEYVSTNVLSSPYHGAGVDGVKYFNTTLAGVSLNPLTTNKIRNSTMQGAAVGAPGTDPANWSIDASTGLSKSIVGKGVDNGINCIDVRFFGTASGAGLLAAIFETTSGVPALVGELWTASVYCRLIAGSTANTAFGLAMEEQSSTPAYLTSQLTSLNLTAPTLAESRAHATRTLSSASVAYARSYVYSAISNGAVVDITLRIGLPQLQKLPYVTPAIPTTGAAASAAIAGFPRCLVESSRTNLLTYSEQFDNAAWTKSTTTVSANNATAPDGGFTADLITSADEVGIYQAVAVTPGVVYTASVFFKKNTCTIYRLRDVSDDHHVVFTVATKTFSSPSNVISYNYQELSNGWFRLWMTYAAVGSFSAHTLRPNSQAGSTTYWQWGAQLEVGSGPSSYIPTLAAAVTRPIDVLAHPISVGNTGTWVVTVSPAEVPSQAATYPVVSLQGATTANQIGVFTSPSGGALSLAVFANAVQTVSGAIQASISAGGVYRVALSWSAASRRISYCVNGGTPGTVTAVDMPSALTSFSTAAGNPWIGTVADSEIFTVEHPPETLKLLSAL